MDKGNYKDILWQKFGKLTVLADFKARNKKNNRPYRKLFCKCDCGQECFCNKEKVLNGSKRSCGCLQKENHKTFGNRQRLGYGVASANERYTAYKAGARRRNLEFNLTKEQFFDIVTKPCIYCGTDKSQIYRRDDKRRNGAFIYTGIDRYDTKKGYTVENCVPCCTKCNRIKLDMEAGEMLEQLKKIIANEKRWLRKEGDAS